MKFIQITASRNTVYALGEDGCVYRWNYYEPGCYSEGWLKCEGTSLPLGGK